MRIKRNMKNDDSALRQFDLLTYPGLDFDAGIKKMRERSKERLIDAQRRHVALVTLLNLYGTERKQ